MSILSLGMIGAGVATLVAGLILVRARFAAASTAGKILVMGPVFEAVALAMFAAEHFFAARDLAGIVPRWLPGALFWTYFFGVALLAAAISFVVWRYVRWSALLLALFFLLIVVTVDVPGLPAHIHERLFWTLTVRELVFACGAMVLAASQWRRAAPGKTQTFVGKLVYFARLPIACIFVFYAIEHFLYPLFVPGVPLEKMIPTWFPAPRLLSYCVGGTLLGSGIGLLFRRSRRAAAAVAGFVLVLLTAFFYVPILVMEIHLPLALEGLNYVGDTLLFASTALLAGFGADATENP